MNLKEKLILIIGIILNKTTTKKKRNNAILFLSHSNKTTLTLDILLWRLLCTKWPFDDEKKKKQLKKQMTFFDPKCKIYL